MADFGSMEVPSRLVWVIQAREVGLAEPWQTHANVAWFLIPNGLLWGNLRGSEVICRDLFTWPLQGGALQ